MGTFGSHHVTASIFAAVGNAATIQRYWWYRLLCGKWSPGFNVLPECHGHRQRSDPAHTASRCCTVKCPQDRGLLQYYPYIVIRLKPNISHHVLSDIHWYLQVEYSGYLVVYYKYTLKDRTPREFVLIWLNSPMCKLEAKTTSVILRVLSIFTVSGPLR